jgi:signal peptidase I
LRSAKERPTLSIRDDRELILPNAVMIEIIRDVLGKGASFRFSAKGTSMYPFIRGGDTLTLTPVENVLSIGDVIAFINPRGGDLIVHRLISRKRDTCIFKGDNIDIPNDPVPYANILGKVSRVERSDHVVRSGLGNEKYIIAFFSRLNMLTYARRLRIYINRSIGKIFFATR